MNCGRAKELMSLGVDRDAPKSGELRAMEIHVSGCQSCRKVQYGLALGLVALQQYAKVPPAESLKSSVWPGVSVKLSLPVAAASSGLFSASGMIVAGLVTSALLGTAAIVSQLAGFSPFGSPASAVHGSVGADLELEQPVRPAVSPSKRGVRVGLPLPSGLDPAYAHEAELRQP